VVTKLVPSSGRLSQTSTGLIQTANIKEIPNYRLSVLMSTITKLLVDVMCHVLSLSIWSQVQWTPYVLVHLDNYLDQRTSFSDRVEQETTMLVDSYLMV